MVSVIVVATSASPRRPMYQTPSSKESAARLAASIARRVAPTPGMPVMATARSASRRPTTMESSVSRPTKDVCCDGSRTRRTARLWSSSTCSCAARTCAPGSTPSSVASSSRMSR
ncbi:Uncharacterised protein [Mycobacteroides abscessus subsp. abscessus]|nr:Uncharacterised protein [Mycobacteroides abscessus subsp. abscessus]